MEYSNGSKRFQNDSNLAWILFIWSLHYLNQQKNRYQSVGFCKKLQIQWKRSFQCPNQHKSIDFLLVVGGIIIEVKSTLPNHLQSTLPRGQFRHKLIQMKNVECFGKLYDGICWKCKNYKALLPNFWKIYSCLKLQKFKDWSGKF